MSSHNRSQSTFDSLRKISVKMVNAIRKDVPFSCRKIDTIETDTDGY